MKPILKIFYKTISAYKDIKKFTKHNILENFINDDKLNISRGNTVKHVILES